jgi:hypothetical protein
MRTIKTCQCCGADFWAGNISAKWCSSRCSMRAYQRRRRGVPEADWAINALSPVASHVHQPTLVEDDDDLNDLPTVWRLPPAGTEERIWRGTAIQRREADGFVNATAMCKAGGKRWENYHRCDRTQEYIAALASVVAEKPCGAAVAPNRATGNRGAMGNPITGSALIHTIQGGTPELQGTWIHPRLAIDLARWISPAFAVWMDGWFLESLTPALQPTRQPLQPGVHVVAASQRGAAMIWHEVITAEVTAALARLNPAWRSETCLPLSHHYTFTPAT